MAFRGCSGHVKHAIHSIYRRAHAESFGPGNNLLGSSGRPEEEAHHHRQCQPRRDGPDPARGGGFHAHINPVFARRHVDRQQTTGIREPVVHWRTVQVGLPAGKIEDLINKFDKNCVSEPLSDDIFNSPITIDEIKYHVKKLKNNKAAGHDGLIAEFIKFGTDEVISALCIIYNTILDTGERPEQWALGLISPVHKKASINICVNYRKVTVMPVLGKILEAILNSRLIFHNQVQNFR